MAAVTQSVTNYLGGVSKQNDRKKLPGQVREALNALPDPTFGLRKRPGTKYISDLKWNFLPWSSTKPKWFYIDNNETDQYIGCIDKHTVDGTDVGFPRVWHTDGTECAITHIAVGGIEAIDYLDPTNNASDYDILTVQDTTFITNKKKVVEARDADVYVPKSLGTVFVKQVKYNTSYEVNVTIDGNTFTPAAHVTINATSEVTTDDELTNTADSIVSALKTNLDGEAWPGDMTVTKLPTSLELEFKEPVVQTIPTDNGTSGTGTLDQVFSSVSTTLLPQILTVSGISAADPLRVPEEEVGYYTIDSSQYTTSGTGEDAIFKVTVDEVGACTVEVIDGGKRWAAADSVTLTNLLDGDPSAGAAPLTFNIATVSSTGASLTVDVKIGAAGEAVEVTKNTGGPGYLKNDYIEIAAADVSTVDNVVTRITDHVGKGFDITAIDNQGNATMVAFNDEVSNQTKIPDQSVADRVVKINNTAQVKDAYYVKFTPDNGTSGTGYWTESLGPNMSPGLKGETMPHTLLRTGLHTFNFQQALTDEGESSWGDRLVGDDDTNKHPSFVSDKIAQTFFHNNRLGVLTADNVVMSRASEFYEFYSSSALTASDSDPIDVNTSSIKPAKLHSVLPTAQGLILFSSQQQFILFADSKILTPGSTVIRGISNYEIDTTIPPVEVGTAVTFVSKTPSFTRVHSVNTRGNEESPLIQDIGKVVSEWIPESIDSLITSPQNQMIALYGRTDPHVYFYKTHFVGDKNIMQAWFRWKMPANVEFIHIAKDVMWTVVNDGTNHVLLKSNISKSADDDVLQTQDGQYVNPHMDMFAYPTAAGKVELVDDSGTPDADGNNTRIELPFTPISGLTPVILIKGTGVTESGFTTTPTVSGTGPYYFTVANKDLKTSTIYTDIALGYQFEYDIELPKTYFKLTPDGTQYDYAASLTISRMKFAVGLSSGLGFKLKRKGYTGPSKEYTGDGSTTAFSVDFPLKEENGIVVKLDGAKQDPSTYSVTTTDTDAVVTFNSAPEQYTVSRLYGGSGYTAATGVATTSVNGTGLTVDTTVNNGSITNIVIHNGSNYVEGEIVSIAGGTEGGFMVGPAQKILITTDTWYDVQTVLEADQYLADDVPMTEEAVFTLPIHQRSDNFDLRVYSNSPFPVALASMMWEGQYSPRYYKRI